ncbi:acid protease [Mollisia scopiformis]|uniref:Acid protease n=1 Tax=Mollisia scopiformis TaxID=149040 RepID=A0A194X3U2_MOLSC|nr:acid protease [Mollisia scopiformis]KUJ14497.1 acid protease [Mollisia scopiformis]
MWFKSLVARKAVNPTPFSFAPSQFWEGNDGTWSTFIVRIGTPPQTFRVLPSTVGIQTWVPAPEDCALLNKNVEDCSNLRGVQLFENGWTGGFMVNESSSWDSIGLFQLGLENSLNYTGNGRYGFETIGLEIQNSGGLTLQHQVVAGTEGLDFMLGIFGLGPLPTNFSDFNEPQPSYMYSLKNQSLIPSLSFGYTAGAPYRDKEVLGSLTLGGYDSSRFKPNNMSFTFGAEDAGSLLVGLQAIQADNALDGVVELLPKGIISLIDSTVPEIWLPVEACALFETSFGLVHDPHTDRYLVNDSIHSQLQTLNPSLTFQLGNDVYGGESINIVLPYAAFDLQASYPLYVNTTNYFPLRRAAKDSQYVIGRTFLQESYIIADYERQTFTVSQAQFSNNATSTIVAILPPSTSKSSKISHAALVGIVVASVIVGLLLLLGGAFVVKRSRKQKHQTQQAEEETETKLAESLHSPILLEPNVAQLPGSEAHEVLGSSNFSQELETANFVHEIGGNVLSELHGTSRH